MSEARPAPVRAFGEGAQGDHVRDLQRRLRRLGHDPGPSDGLFASRTRRALEGFQHSNQLDADGICGPMTWSRIVEAGYQLGDRHLYLTSPAIRGDDVAELQARLGGLGFDAGRVDGILGEGTAAAVADFQRNVGLVADGIVGPDTLTELRRFGARRTQSEPVASIRERQRLLAGPTTLRDRHIVVAEPGGLGHLSAAIRRDLVDRGAHVLTIHHPDGSAQARQANGYQADVIVGLQAAGRDLLSYYEVPGFTSTGGRALAGCLRQDLVDLLPNISVSGQRLPLLRETRMTAVVWKLAEARLAATHPTELAQRVTQAVDRWAQTLDTLDDLDT